MTLVIHVIKCLKEIELHVSKKFLPCACASRDLRYLLLYIPCSITGSLGVKIRLLLAKLPILSGPENCRKSGELHPKKLDKNPQKNL